MRPAIAVLTLVAAAAHSVAGQTLQGCAYEGTPCGPKARRGRPVVTRGNGFASSVD
jgi:hypothetical protein